MGDSDENSTNHAGIDFNALNNPVFIHNYEPDGTCGVFLYANDAACRKFNYSREELQNLNP